MSSANVWFTGDQHWGHAKMMRPDFAGRPFANVEEMDEALIQAWVARVQPGDRVYHLGDVIWGNFNSIVDRLPGQLYLVMGNHDEGKTAKHPRWIWAKDAAYFKVNDQKFHLSHYAFETWRSSHHGCWHLHGHSHGSLPPRGRRLDVGVDNHEIVPGIGGAGFGNAWGSPWSFEEVAAVMALRKFVQLDHHAERDVDRERSLQRAGTKLVSKTGKEARLERHSEIAAEELEAAMADNPVHREGDDSCPCPPCARAYINKSLRGTFRR